MYPLFHDNVAEHMHSHPPPNNSDSAEFMKLRRQYIYIITFRYLMFSVCWFLIYFHSKVFTIRIVLHGHHRSILTQAIMTQFFGHRQILTQAIMTQFFGHRQIHAWSWHTLKQSVFFNSFRLLLLYASPPYVGHWMSPRAKSYPWGWVVCILWSRELWHEQAWVC